jgi:[acyl-carrier-protein] S-malonyltransferase
LAVVFPGQGTPGGEVGGEIREAVRRYEANDGELPYQLSVFASSIEVYHKLEENGVEPDVVAGHSLGEYAAAHAAGSLGLEDGVRLVTERDRLMTEAARNPGGMTAIIGAGTREVVDAVDSMNEAVVAANFNTPRQTVISGEIGAMESVAGRVGGKKRKLDVAGAFHSPFMQEAAVAMQALLAEVPLDDPEIPMISGIDGAVLAKADDVRLALRDQMLSPVRWVAVVERLAALGVEEVVEAGGGTLVRMLRDFKDVEIKGRAAKEVLG